MHFYTFMTPLHLLFCTLHFPYLALGYILCQGATCTFFQKTKSYSHSCLLPYTLATRIPTCSSLPPSMLSLVVDVLFFKSFVFNFLNSFLWMFLPVFTHDQTKVDNFSSSCSQHLPSPIYFL